MPENIPAIALWICAGMAFFLWIKIVRRPAPSGGSLARFLARAGSWLACLTALFFLSQSLQRHLTFATDWPIWAILAAGALAIEASRSFYSFEARYLPPAQRKLLPSLRILLIILATIALCQPVKVVETSRNLDRYVAVAIDESASMGMECADLDTGLRIRLGEYFSLISSRRPFRSEDPVSSLESLRQETAAQNDRIVAMEQIDAGSGEKARTALRSIQEAYAEDRKKIESLCETIGKLQSSPGIPLPDPAKARAGQICGRIKSEITAPLDARARLLEVAAGVQDGAKDGKTPAPDYRRMAEIGKAVAASIGDIAREITVLGEECDAAAYSSLSPEDKSKVDGLMKISRANLARRILSTQPPGGKGPSLIGSLSDTFGLKLYSFSGSPSEMEAAELGKDQNIAADQAPGTNIASVLSKSLSDIPSEQLAGILLFTDGRHNSSDSVESIAARLGKASVPVFPVCFGSGRPPPKDAAVVSVDAPEILFHGDKFGADITLKLDNLAGSKVNARPFDGTKIVDSREIEVKGESVREKILLSDKPETTGYHSYRVAIDRIDGEVVAENNSVSVPVNVTDDRIRVLYVEQNPRWEFRYLKNLFLNRDRSVSLQYVLLKPDRIEAFPEKPVVAASASRPAGEAEATSLPAGEDEWMKFDAVILGDVDAGALGVGTMEILRKFVSQRGGSLILVAGPLKMPATYADTPLEELIPASFRAGVTDFSKASEQSFRLALTSEGGEHIVTRLSPSPEENSRIWEEMPPLFWRHPIIAAKPGATVLAFAFPFDPPDFLRKAPESGIPSEEVLRRRRQYELENALLICQNYSAGRVAMLCFDQSWRLRYREGDTYHHKFWGQLLRWATSDKIMFGSARIRMAADKSRYTPSENIRIRARITGPGYTALPDARPSIRIMKDGAEMRGGRLNLEPGSQGIYSAEMGSMPPGDYRIELDSAGLPGEIAAEAASVRCEFGVAAASPDELVELSADTGTLNRIAALTGGEVLAPDKAPSAIGKLGSPSLVQTEQRQISIWNSWLLLLVISAIAALEWIVRKRVNLP